MKNKQVILLLNDESGVLDFMETLLDTAGFECLRATNSQQALEILRKCPIDLIIQDVKRPDDDGRVFYEILKTDKKLQKIPVLFTTACRIEKLASISKTMEQFGDDHIRVPFDVDKFFSVIKKILVSHKKILPADFPSDMSKV